MNILYDVTITYGDFGKQTYKCMILGYQNMKQFNDKCKKAINCHSIIAINAITGEVVYEHNS